MSGVLGASSLVCLSVFHKGNIKGTRGGTRGRNLRASFYPLRKGIITREVFLFVPRKGSIKGTWRGQGRNIKGHLFPLRKGNITREHGEPLHILFVR